MIPIRTRLRHLAQLRRAEGVKTALCLLGILVCYGIVGSIDYADAQRAEVEAAERRAQQAQRAMRQATGKLAECMNGKPVATYTDAKGRLFGVVCGRALEVRL